MSIAGPRARNLASLAATALLAIAGSARAAESAARVRYDVQAGAFSASLPHGTSFFLDIDAPADAAGALVRYAPATDAKCPGTAPGDAILRLGILGPAPSAGSSQIISTQIDELDSGTRYCFWITVLLQWSESSRKSFATRLVQEIVTAVRRQTPSISEEEASRWIRKALGKIGGLSDAQVDTAGLTDRLRRKTYEDLKKTVNLANEYVEQKSYWDKHVKSVDQVARTLTKENLGEHDPARLIQQVEALVALQLPDPALPGANPFDFSKVTEAVKTIDGEATPLIKSACSAEGPPPAGCPALRSLASTLVRLDAGAAALSNAWSEMTAQLAAFQQMNMRIALTEPVTLPTLSTPAGFTERAQLYISGSVGMAGVHFRNDGWDAALFVGVSFYFAPLDKDTPLGSDLAFWRRFSLVAGYTLGNVSSPSGAGRGALDGNGALLGAALRLTDYVQLGGGMVLVRQASSNPLLTRSQLRATPYASLSIDIDIVDIVKGIFAKAK